jgi:hypothetical protein
MSLLVDFEGYAGKATSILQPRLIAVAKSRGQVSSAVRLLQLFVSLLLASAFIGLL